MTVILKKIDADCISYVGYPSCSDSSAHAKFGGWAKSGPHYYLDYCPNCARTGRQPYGHLVSGSKRSDEITCTQKKGGCDSDWCGVCAKEKMNNSNRHLLPCPHPEGTQFEIFQKPTNNPTWNRYLFQLSNVYRIMGLQNVSLGANLSVNSAVDLTRQGRNWEKMLEIGSSTAGFSGGSYGKEKHVSINFYADGAHFIPSQAVHKSCNQLKIITTTLLMDPADSNKVLAHVSTQYVWNGQNLTVSTTIAWVLPRRIYVTYVGALPAVRNSNISYYGQLDKSPTVETLDGSRSILRIDSSKGTTWDIHKKLYMSMEATVGLNGFKKNGTGKSFFSNDDGYNTLYLSRITPPDIEQVYSGTRWYFGTVYKVWGH